MSNVQRTKRSWPQFSIRALLFLITLSALVVGPWMHGVRNQKRAVAEIEALGGRVTHETTWMGGFLPESMRERIAIDYSASVVEVFLHYRTVDRRMTRHTSDELDRAVAAMDQLPRLRRLSLHTLHLQNDDLARFRPLSDQIETLSVNELFHGDLKATSLKHLEGWPQLTTLSFLSRTTGAEGFESLAKIPNLQVVSIGSGTLEDPSLAAIAKAKSLTTVRFFQCRFEGESLAHFQKLVNLSSVSMQNMKPVVHYEGYTIDKDGNREIMGGPHFRFERAEDWYVAPQPGPFGKEFPQDAYDRWLQEEALPGVEVSMWFSS